MLFCAKCGRRMRCEKNGHGARAGDHAYPGDLYSCRFCHSIVIAANDAPVHDPDRTIVAVYTAIQD